MHAAGGPDAFLEDHAMIVCSDHSQSQVERGDRPVQGVRRLRLEPPAPARARRDAEPPEIAVCPSSRSAQVYVLDRDRRAELVPRLERTALALEGVDLVMHMTDHPDGEAVVRGARAASCASCPAATLTDLRGERWSVEGDLDAARPARCATARDRLATYPDALGRVWSALRCRTVRRRCCCRPSPATSSSTGAATTTSAAARTARCTPTTRWARCCGAAPAPTAPTPRSSGRCATSCRWCGSTSASPR